MEEEHDMTSLRSRRKKSSVGIACCFSGTTQHHRRASLDLSSSSIPHPSPRRSPTAWIKSKTTELPEIKGKCRNFISRMARHRRHSSAEFTYDPLSYSLNFDDDAPSSSDDFPAMNFTARLPVSPPRKTTSTPFEHHLPRSPVPKSPPDVYHTAERWKRDEFGTPEIAGGSDDLRRGFEALSVSMKRSSSSMKESPAGTKVERQKRNENELSSPRAKAAAEVRRSLEADEVIPPVGTSSNRGVLVELC